MPKQYISVIKYGSNEYEIKDKEARLDILAIKSGVTGAMHYIGITSAAITDGSKTSTITANGVTYHAPGIVVTALASTFTRYAIGDKEIEGKLNYAWILNDGSSLETIVYTETLDIVANETPVYKLNGNLTELVGTVNDYYPVTSYEVELKNGATVGYQNKEFVWTGASWSEFGSTGSLGTLAFKEASDLGLTGSSSSKLVTTTIKEVDSTDTASEITATATRGLETVTVPTQNITTIVGSTSVRGVKTNETTSVRGVKTNETASVYGCGTDTTVGSASNWYAGSLPSLSITGDNNETLEITFGTGSLPSLTVTSATVATKANSATTVPVMATSDTTVPVMATADTTVPVASLSDISVAVLQNDTTLATGTLTSDGSGVQVMTGITYSSKTLATAKSGTTTVATGSVASDGTGATVITASPNAVTVNS